MTATATHTERVLRAYHRRTLGHSDDTWDIRASSLGGRGVFATCDLHPGDLIFHDRPLVWGPRAKMEEPMCASCHRRGRVFQCVTGCNLPICSPECSSSQQHIPECRLLKDSITLQEGWRLDLVGTLTPLRCLTLSPDDREVVHHLQGNQGKMHGFEVDLLKKYMKEKLLQEDEEWMRHCCMVMDTNAFEFLKVLEDGSNTSLRGLYPLAAMMNHQCSPNSCHTYNKDGIMKVFAAKHIKQGEEVTTSYSSLLWSTTIRRLNLAQTKHFWCRCARCTDPTEFGSLLSALPCVMEGCSGALLPSQPLKYNSAWVCGSCNAEVSYKQATQLQAAQGVVLQTLAAEDPVTTVQFLTTQSAKLPQHCQLIAQLKTNLMWQLGHKSGFMWQDISQEMLDFKEKICYDILQLLELLRCGFCRMKGLVLLELYDTLCEQQKRISATGLSRKNIDEEKISILATADKILCDDATVEKKLKMQEHAQPAFQFLIP